MSAVAYIDDRRARRIYTDEYRIREAVKGRLGQFAERTMIDSITDLAIHNFDGGMQMNKAINEALESSQAGDAVRVRAPLTTLAVVAATKE